MNPAFIPEVVSALNSIYPPGLTKWNVRYLDQALFVAKWSKDPTDKIGCVISDDNDIIIGQGFNGFPKGILDHKEILKDKNRKRMRTVHAELNAIHFSTKSLAGSTFHITHSPCATCAGSIIQHRPANIVYLIDELVTGSSTSLSPYWEESTKEASEMFKEAGIQVTKVLYSFFLSLKSKMELDFQ